MCRTISSRGHNWLETHGDRKMEICSINNHGHADVFEDRIGCASMVRVRLLNKIKTILCDECVSLPHQHIFISATGFLNLPSP